MADLKKKEKKNRTFWFQYKRTIPISQQTAQPIEASVRDLSDITGTATNSLDCGCGKVLIRACHIRLELSQDGGDVRFGGKVRQDLQLMEKKPHNVNK